MRSIPWLVAVCFIATAAQAQDDDLAPLVPTKGAPKKQPVRVRPPPAKKAPVVTPKEDDDLAPLVAGKTELWVKGQAGAVLSIDGKEVGALPQPAQALPPGEHQVMVKRKGWSLFVKKVTLAAGKTAELTAAMQAVNAVVSVSCDVPGADVLVNGRVVGTTPVTDLELPASSIELEVRKDDFKPAKQRLVLVAGREYPVSVKLKAVAHTAVAAVEPHPDSDTPVKTAIVPTDVHDSVPVTAVAEVGPSTPITSRWYFWAGLGVAVAAGAVGAGFGIDHALKAQTPKPVAGTVVCNGRECDGYIGYPTAILPYASGIRF